jgi:uncharacterized protein (TIGR03437 family)
MRCNALLRALFRIVPRAAGILVLALAALGSSFAQAPALVPSTSQLTLDAIENGPAPLSQTFTVSAANGSSVNIETLVDAGSAGTPAPSWITVTPHLATTPAQVQVAANPAGLAPGAYPARIQFTDVQGDSLGSPVAVTLQISTAPAQLAISPPVVNLAGPITKGYVQTGIFLRNLGPGTLGPVSVTVVSGYPWLSAVVPSCETVCAITVRAAVVALTPGVHNGLLQVNTALGSTNVPVAVFAAGHGPFVQLAPEGLQFDTINDTNLVDSRTFSLQNTGDAPANWVAGVVAGGAWLSVGTPSGVTAPGSATQLTAGMNAGFMGPGDYGGLISISATDGSFNTLYVPVVLRIETLDTPPVPLLSTGGLVFQAQVGSQGQQLPVTLSAGSVDLIDFQVSSQSSGWLSGGPMTGKVSGPSPAPLSIVETPIALQTGFYSGLVNVAFGAGALRSLNVGISVTDPAVTSCVPQLLYLTETALANDFATRIGFPTPLEAVLVDDCGNFISNGLVNASFSNGDPDLALEPLGQGLYAATWMPGHASSTLLNGVATVALQGFVPALPIASSELTGTVATDIAPAVSANGVLNNLNPQPGSPVAPGTVVQIYGTALWMTSSGGMAGSGSIVNGQLSSMLNGVSVSVGGIAAPLYYGSSGQINAQIPNELEAGQQYELLVNVNGLYSNAVTINTTAVQPGLASLPDGTVIAQDSSYNLITTDNPAHAGQVIILYLTGMGATNPPVSTGATSPSSPPAQVAVAPQVTVGTANAQVLFAGLSPGSVGLYQINVEIPAGVGTGNVPIVVTQGGVASNAVTVPVE